MKSSANTALHRQAAVPHHVLGWIQKQRASGCIKSGSRRSELAVASKVDPKAVVASKSSELVVSASSGGIEKQRAHLGLSWARRAASIIGSKSNGLSFGSTCCEHHLGLSWAPLASARASSIQLGLQAFSIEKCPKGFTTHFGSMFCARHPGCWLFHDVLAFSPSAGFFTICLSGVVSG